MKSIHTLIRKQTPLKNLNTTVVPSLVVKKFYSTRKSFTIEPLTKENVKQAIMLTSMTFGKHEPIMGNKFQPTDIYHFATVLANRAAEEELGHVAVDKSGLIVGAVYSCDHVKSVFDNAFSSIDFYPDGLQLFEDLHTQYFEYVANRPKHEQFGIHTPENMFTPQNIGKILHFLVGVTADFYQGNGVMSELSKVHLQACKEKGFEQAFAECSSNYSTKALEKNGFSVQNRVVYSDYEIKDEKLGNRKPFLHVPAPHQSMNLVWNYKL